LTIITKPGASEIRCASCNKLLAKGRAMVLSIKCPRCRTLNTFTDRPGAASRAAVTAATVQEK